MRKAKTYLTGKGWKADLNETVKDFKDLAIIIKRNFKPSDDKYGNLTSREIDRFVEYSNSLLFFSEADFQLYAMTNKWPIGPCLIYDFDKKTERRFDDSFIN